MENIVKEEGVTKEETVTKSEPKIWRSPRLKKEESKFFVKELTVKTDEKCDSKSLFVKSQNASVHPDDMSDCINNVVLAILDLKKWEIAIDFLTMIGGYPPSTHVFHKVISNMMLEQKNKTVQGMADDYVRDLLKSFSPCVENGDYYFDTLFPSKMERNIYEHIHQLLKCCLEGGCSNPGEPNKETVCGKNCRLLLKYIVHILTKEHQERKALSKGQSFICRIFWPIRNPDSISENCKRFICTINDLFQKDDIDEEEITFEMLKILQNILAMLAETVLLFSESTPYTEVEAIYYSSIKALQEICREICINCPNIFSNYSKLDLFLQTQHLGWFKIMLCNSILNHFTKGRWTGPQNISLRNIVFSYMFKKSESIKTEDIKDVTKQDACQRRFLLQSKKKPVRIFTHRNSKKIENTRTPMHKACIEDHINILDDLLDESVEMIHRKDCYDRTPLHYACERSHYLCAKILLLRVKKKSEEVSDPSFLEEVFAPDCNGQTPLHICAEKNHLDIAELVIEFGGGSALTVTDKSGRTPLDSAGSQRMRNFLTKHVATPSEEPESSTSREVAIFMCYQDIEPILCKTSNECTIQISCLYMLLAEYTHFFCLQKFHSTEETVKMPPSVDTVRQHFLKVLKHDANIDEIVRFYDDLYIMKHFTLLFGEFKSSIRKSPIYDDDVSDALTYLKWFAKCL